ncbi:hypothetical protein ACFX13_030399 [Malus domestica]
MSFWARWDVSPNRQLIHEILEAFEERLVEKKRSRNSKLVAMAVAGRESEAKFGEGGDASGEGVGAEESSAVVEGYHQSLEKQNDDGEMRGRRRQL